ncbi:MAG: substrate-binding domain-containing protein [Rhodospirillales bacterium]|nr:substrate-binding domain-containing protein [Rhodospirillales bacterium]MDH3911992.1 substrate-binding domain-containing protein [Rhodospirillales bacterium]MDH3965912.1 substrate-binding domain-containing protein [Rhodospirillales bacterium]
MAAALLGAVALGATAGTTLAAGNIRIHGSSTIAKKIVWPNKGALESKTGLSLSVITNGSGNGLKDLAAGKADMAMISAPLEVAAELTNRKAPGSLDVTEFQAHRIGSVRIFFVVHPSNPVKSLSAEQVRDIFTGKITNWKEVGGLDSKILLVNERAGHGTRTVLESVFMQGRAFSRSGRVMKALAQQTQVVAQAPNAITFGNMSSIDSSVVVLQGLEVLQPLSLVTKGAPKPEMAKLIAEAAAIGARL